MSPFVVTLAETAPARTGRRWLWSVLRVVTVLTTLSAFTQAVLAGGVVGGRIESLPLHSTNGLLLVVGTLTLLVTLVLAWRPGGGPAWAPLAGLLLTAATLVQLVLGYSRSLTVHVPLGTTIIVATVMLLVWVWRRPLPEPRS